MWHVICLVASRGEDLRLPISDPEMAALKEKRKNIEAKQDGSEPDLRIKQALKYMEERSPAITEWEETSIWQLINWGRILSSEESLVCRYDGLEIR